MKSDIESKRQAIESETIRMKRYLYMAKRIARYPEPKRLGTKFNRAFRIAAYSMSAFRSALNIRTIKEQPIFPSGGLPILGELDPKR